MVRGGTSPIKVKGLDSGVLAGILCSGSGKPGTPGTRGWVRSWDNPAARWPSQPSPPAPTAPLRARLSGLALPGRLHQGAQSASRGPDERTPQLPASYQLCFPDPVLTDPKAAHTPLPLCQASLSRMPRFPGHLDPQPGGADSPATSLITFPKPQPLSSGPSSSLTPQLFGAEPEPAGCGGGKEEEREGRRRPCLSPAASHCLTALSLFLSSQKSLHPLPPPPPCFFPSITSSLHLLE